MFLMSPKLKLSIVFNLLIPVLKKIIFILFYIFLFILSVTFALVFFRI